ncbi:hypothetical protein PV421_48000, partial [Streptomyces scabiei]|nr:hypothetical protein [Streptomyces scabiei]
MARGAPSPADLQVIRELAARGAMVTTSQLESWRRAGLLPRHRRRGLGRGRGRNPARRQLSNWRF